ncbi:MULTISPECIES: TetR/AcrR family transcriptional regulator [unclassified Streptomyces]|uniref:TetR/AcrR family transcriptional regulator n=1 Tax=unclassified Streptomyces TaxID=2593676 RepID=UPI0006F65A41|nr:MULTISPECIES: TetR/AcrR family transcriptional regulator [unclassified Streptomyces]KQX50913.1 TetR family transcriptional regulator [Streptomyces sp. Root1304]KRA85079.1 TetR family transcriptional regulator [Streptomyces sp. Root66D1]
MSGSTGSGTKSKTDGRVERGNQTRRLVLGRTMDIASVEGLEGLSLGRIATELQLSKSGVFALFGSKEELQLATVRAAVAVFAERVVTPLADVPPGARRVRDLCRKWLAYSSERVFAGGCFFYAVSAEFDARTGPVHDAVARTRHDWTAYVEGALSEARAVGDLAGDLDVEQVAFEVIALMEAANAQSVLFGDPGVYARAERGITARLRASATDRGRDALDDPGTPDATDPAATPTQG